jgi:hypothetical protein
MSWFLHRDAQTIVDKVIESTRDFIIVIGYRANKQKSFVLLCATEAG